ncbi:BAG domain-containing protein Samui isoform X2 [Ostrinia furnacalis]|uniref:BAG domain-containing protein Samui isoform X2 n=1 Tax=Ostrinia furnacalis TaxID=93504 RepID=UPI0010386790|nr:BAG domain-containing protein Samui isoform X2 [Ostrinia furnacalis]
MKRNRGFPFDEEEGSGAWSELAARHPDIAARLRQRPATWARKRRPSSQDATEDFGESFGGFDRFPFDDIPPEFREHFPTHWNRRYSARDEPPPPAAPPAPPSPQHSSAATQTEPAPSPAPAAPSSHLPQYGLRNTVDLGQRSAADPSLVDADDRGQRSMSAPPDGYAHDQNNPSMSSPNHPEHAEPQPSNVRHIPIFVEGRDEPVINKSAHFGEPKPAYAPPPQPTAHNYADFDDGPAFHAPPNFSRAFGTPFNKGFRQGPQPFVQQKVYPQTAFARGASPQRSQSPKPQPQPDEHYVKVPVHHEHAPPRPEPQPRPQPQPQQQQQQQKPAPQQQAPPKQPTPPPQPKPQPPSANDPITQILSIQTDVLNLMSEVENFTGTKKDKRYLFLDEMLTRNLIKLDNIETEGKENIRQARKEAIKCIQKCIAVLEAKAEKGSNAAASQDVVMNENAELADPVAVNGAEVEMKDAPAEQVTTEQKEEAHSTQSQQEIKDTKPQEEKVEAAEVPAAQVAAEPQAADTRPEDKAPEQNAEQKDQETTDKKTSPKKGGKNVKKRDKSKDNKEKDSNKEQTEKKETEATMQVDATGDAAVAMELDGAASQ